MKIQEEETKKSLINRLRRMEGQLRGVEQMLENERECREIMQQLLAVRSAMKSTIQVFLQEYASDCLLNNMEAVDRQQREELLADLVTIMGKSMA